MSAATHPHLNVMAAAALSPALPQPALAAVPGRTSLRLLIVEDCVADALVLVHLLGLAGFELEWTRVETEAEYLAALDSPLDIILSGYALAQFSGLDALALLNQRGLRIPFILTGMAGEEAAVAALQLGADDYLLKDRLARLGQAVRRALDQHALREANLRSEHELRANQQRLLEQERASRGQAEAAVRMRDEFVAIASHELRTPVTTIKIGAQSLMRFLERGELERTRVTAYLQMVNLMSDRLTLLIADLLDVSRLRTGQLELHPEPVDLARLTGEIVTQQRMQLGSEHSFSLRALECLPLVNADPHRIQQVLSNLVENAIKYSPAGGKIEIALRPQTRGVLATVSDEGIGLPTDALETIFEPFGRAINAQRSYLPGMGLGLYIGRQIIEQHGGRIWATSDGEGQGAQISVWLPALIPFSPPAERPAASSEGVAD